MYSQHVRSRHNIQQPSQQPVDGRLPTNPQPIPHPTGISPHPPRGFSNAGGARSFPTYSPGQSPHQSGQYFASPANTNDINRAHVVASAPAPVKPHGNGTPQPYYFSTPMPQYQQAAQMPPNYNPPVTKFSQQTGPTTQFPQNVPQNTPPPPPPVMHSFLPYQRRFMSPNPPNQVINTGHSQLAATSPTYYPAAQTMYQSPMPPVSYPGYESYQNQTPQQTVIQQSQPQVQAAPTRKKIIIRDPNTGIDVTNDVLSSRGTDPAAGNTNSVPTPVSTSNVSTPKPQDQICAQFAAKVAAAANQQPPAETKDKVHVPEGQVEKVNELVEGQVSNNGSETTLPEKLKDPTDLIPAPDVIKPSQTSDIEPAEQVNIAPKPVASIPTNTSSHTEVNGASIDVPKTDAAVEVLKSEAVEQSTGDIKSDASKKVVQETAPVQEPQNAASDTPEEKSDVQTNLKDDKVDVSNGAASDYVKESVAPPSIEIVPATPPTAVLVKESKVDSSVKKIVDHKVESDVVPSVNENLSNSKEETPSQDSVQDISQDVKVETPGLVNNVQQNEVEPKVAEQEEDQADVNDKKVYDRTFLMQFRFHNTSMEKPRDLPTIEDIIMDRPLPKSSVSNAMPSLGDGMYRGGDRPGSDFTPKYMSSGGGGGHGRTSSRGMRSVQQRSGGYGGHGGAPKPTKKISIQREPDLNRTENAWKPSKVDAGNESHSEEETKTADILRRVRAILNKLTPQKFQPLMEKLQALEINTEVRLRGVIDLIFEKAIDEPNFCEAYANMCRTMSQVRIATSSAANPGSTVEFRKILLTRCQREFEKDRANEEALKVLREKFENASAQEKPVIKEELDLAETKERRRMLGNIRFIGELFKLSMLTETIMHNCIMALFRGKDEDSLESLCRLLTTIGKDLDHDKGKQRMTQYFQQIEKIINEKKTSSRVRFMLQDVMDLRMNGWVPRPIQSQGPKTIDQIHADAKEEKQQKALQVAAAAQNAPKSQSRGGRMGSRGGGGAGGHAGGDEGWTKVQQKPTRYDPNKMKLSKTQFDESTVTLGPTRGKLGWKSGSGSSTKTGSGGYSSRDSSDSGSTPRSSTPTTMNRFSALGGGSSQQQEHTSPYNQRRVPSRHSSREGTKSGSRGSMPAPARDEKQALIDTTRRFTSQDPKLNLPAPVPTVMITEEVMKTKCKSIIEEYLSIVDTKEAQECLLELRTTATMFNIFVRVAMQLSLEKSSIARKNVAKLMVHLLSNNIVSVDEYIKGVLPVITEAVDLELDLPKIWECLADQIAPVLGAQAGGASLLNLCQLIQPLREEEKTDIFVAEVLKQLIQQTNVSHVLEMWNSCQLNWMMITSLSSSSLGEFLERKSLQMFSPHDQLESDPTSKMQLYESNITKLLDKNKTPDENFDAIELLYTAEERVQTTFIRALTVSVCQKAIKQGDTLMEMDKMVIKRHILLLKKYIDTEDKELEAVFALQRLWVLLDQPPNILKLLFDSLYDEEIISEQTFFKWEGDDNPAESEGKGVALLSVNPFFTWLRNADPESDD
uniref:Eukaryotic translation initiation factor 4 gamma 3 n=1 Tax=Phallusia mammillata TaxID=59560 RepID=A0A6F9DCK3_9ASCI|nr:eukaryotic translation initiation factor 4 gamma 3 [Phallusia mammillata]